MTDLPIDLVLPDVVAALRTTGRVVLQAPPGAGKTTRVPLALLQADLTAGLIVMLEPRRLAVRAAADRLAAQLGEQVGTRVGYRMRGESSVGPDCRILVVTEGILTRMVQDDPELTGVGAVIFDEFHERSLQADLGLAFVWEIKTALRPDLSLIVMSATLDAAPVAAMLDDAPVVTAQGRAYPVDIRYLDRSLGPRVRLTHAVADLVARIVPDTDGGVLVFLPGAGEIRQVAAALNGRLPPDCDIRPLYGALPFAAQRAAIAPVTSGRKIVLSTAIAETSLTIEDIRVVVDAGQARRARFDPGSGMSRLVTERVSRAEADQRAGRAGRVAAGTAYRLWTAGEHGALPGFAPPEIAAADLTGLALDLAQWGSEDLSFLTPPPTTALAEARALLRDLGALDAQDRITSHGRALAALPLHPRLGHMLATAGTAAATLAALLDTRDPLRGAGTDLSLRLTALQGGSVPGTADRAALAQIKAEAKRLTRTVPQGARLGAAQMAALAYPDRIALRRPGDDPRYLLSGGKGAMLDAADPLAGQRLLVVTDTDGNPREAGIWQAIPIAEAELRAVLGDRIAWHRVCAWSRRDRRVVAREHEQLGAIVLDDRRWDDAPQDATARAMLDGVRHLGLRPSPAAQRFRARVALVRAGGVDLPDLSDDALMDTLDDWLLPHLGQVRSAQDWAQFDLLDPWRAMLDWDQLQALDRAAPPVFTTPLGRRIPIDYDSEVPEITLRIQEMFGQTVHPTVGRTPLRVTLLSPGHKPVQTTQDLPGFWETSYADVRRDMRGRYPRHPWPEDPRAADPTLRAKPRKH
ncbi:ATP-dependent helicase HrpB [Loktanella sp. SALINAS62]|uniref:ATP-dependent helicase HrpB n=1 Tax=Loktanella sp. SALINAS62 TaxID=2706124 RepID=UPI001B8AA95C|nr:ATP-dependent helicase HrpB [Loktanella sp. SALINAS62]MBS1303981.1 ATP-dependent helicase HrpB [Loktanella sp. SALINAS62]